jgi:hypothetical protein
MLSEAEVECIWCEGSNAIAHGEGLRSMCQALLPNPMSQPKQVLGPSLRPLALLFEGNNFSLGLQSQAERECMWANSPNSETNLPSGYDRKSSQSLM